jgi:hypothetical protein
MIISIALGNTGNTYKVIKDFKQAELNYDGAIALGRELQAPFYLCSYLCYKADLCYIAARLDEAAALNDEALPLAQAVTRKDIVFSCRLLQAKLAAKADPGIGARLFEALVDEYTDPADQAAILYEMYLSNHGQAHRKKALELYRAIYQTSPVAEIKEKIDRLTLDERTTV